MNSDDLHQAIGRLEAKQDQSLNEIAQVRAELQATRAELHTRVTSLEKLRAWGAGVVSAAVFFGMALLWAFQQVRDFVMGGKH